MHGQPSEHPSNILPRRCVPPRTKCYKQSATRDNQSCLLSNTGSGHASEHIGTQGARRSLGQSSHYACDTWCRDFCLYLYMQTRLSPWRTVNRPIAPF